MKATIPVAHELAANASVELSRTGAGELRAAAQLLPFGTSVYLPCPAERPFDAALPMMDALAQAGLEPVPHLVARKVPGRGALEAFLSRIVREFGVRRILVIGGDREYSSGPYRDSLSLLRDAPLAEIGIHEVGVAGYPEGHPHLPADQVEADLRKKIELAPQQGIGIEIVTQFCFAPRRIVEYCSGLAAWAAEVPVYAGIPGPASVSALTRYARHCEVSASLRALSDFGARAVDSVQHAGANQQLDVLVHHCLLRPTTNVIGLHVYAFGGLEETAQWLRARIRDKPLES